VHRTRPDARLRDIAASLGITKRSAHGIVTDLAEAGYVIRQKDVRRNRYRIRAHLPVPEPGTREPIPLENRLRLVTCGSSGCQAAREYSLIRPPRTGFRWIRSRSRPAAVRWPPSCSPLGTRWAMPRCGRAVL